jgi:hypothetical protein
VVSRDISPGTAPAVDVETNTDPAVWKAESVISNIIRLSFRRELSLLLSAFAYEMVFVVS